MFRKFSGFQQNSGDENSPSRFRRRSSDSRSPDSKPPGVGPVGDNYGDDDTSRPSLSRSLQTGASISTVTSHNSRKEGETDSGALGLSVIYTPVDDPKVDIVFIHGLGGTSRWTWTKEKNEELFWPLKFLPLEPDICMARILTFGYNATSRKAGNVGTSILDFAQDLLSDLKNAKDEQLEDLDIGKVPLIFIVHSMGGLIIKEAYLQGQNDPQYQSIVKAITAITFLATPHRGTNFAQTLNRILQSTMITNSKQYMADLMSNSLTLQKLNEQFRRIAPRLDIVSFYETLPTAIGLKNARVMVLERDSSVLGYPGETSKAMNADHHGVCKYDNPKDPNYIIVRNVLKSIVSKIIATSRPSTHAPSSRRDSQDLRSLLAISEVPSVDYIFFRDQWVSGTNDWILEDEAYLEWSDTRDSTTRLLWLNGGAATGKSVMSSFIINNLVERGASCQYFFIRFGDQKKRTLSYLLRSIAYQVAYTVPALLQKIAELSDEAIGFETANARTIWERIFKTIFFKHSQTEPLYWIIDGLDEADDPRGMLKLLSDIPKSFLPIRILLTSRKITEIETSFQNMPSKINAKALSIEGHLENLYCYVKQELSISGSAEFREDIVQRLIEGAQNNFLWLRFAVEKVNSCYRQDEIEPVLQQLPVGMEELYDRMALVITQKLSAPNRALATTILQMVTCSLRVLTLAELSELLGKDISGMLNLARSIVDLCGGFVVIDNDGNVSMVHQTAREYLLSESHRPFQVDPQAGHKQLFLSCMRCLMTIGLRGKLNRSQKPETLDYSVQSWSTHLMSTSLDDLETLQVLKKFLTGYWVLTWIHALATYKQLRVLIQASKFLSKYATKLKERDTASEGGPGIVVNQELFDSWAIDFVKLPGKFGTALRRNPESIYKIVPPFCPQNSSIYQLFGKAEAKSLSVSGLSSNNWDDSLARISFGSGSYASSISAAGAQIAVLTSSSNVLLYESSTFEENVASPIKHGERIYTIALNKAATLLASYGYRTTKIWETATGRCKLSAPNDESRPRPLTLQFTDSGAALLLGCDDARILSLSITEESPTWQPVAEFEEEEMEGRLLNSPNHMAINLEETLVAVAYRNYPISAWEMDGPGHIGHCWRAREELSSGEVTEAIWHPHLPELYGLYIEGIVFKWKPYEDEVVEIATGGSRLTISGDGSLFATGDVHGVTKVYTTSGLSLIYQLASQDNVMGLAFSPDLRRFYDIRGYYGNAWEPNALSKFVDQAGKDIDNDSETQSLTISSTMSLNLSQRIDPITIVATSPVGRLYCSGTEKGTVQLHDTQEGKLEDIFTSKGFLGIEQMSWSYDGRFFCFSNMAKKVFLKSITLPAKGSDLLVEDAFKLPIKIISQGHITQMMFKPDSTLILVATTLSIHIISIKTFEVVNTLKLDSGERKWVLHPKNPAYILGFGLDSVDVLDWELSKIHTYIYEFEPGYTPPPNTITKRRDAVDRVMVTHDTKHILAQLSIHSQGAQDKAFVYFETASFSTAREANPDDSSSSVVNIKPVILPRHLSSQIDLVLSFLTYDRLVFLSKANYVCSLKLNAAALSSQPQSKPAPKGKAQLTSTTSVIRQDDKLFKILFSLPGDWVSRDCLLLSSIWGVERSFLCPRNGEIAVVKSVELV